MRISSASDSEEDSSSICSSEYETAGEEVADGLPVVINSVPVLPLSQPSLEECFKKSGISFDCDTLNEEVINTAHIASIAKKITRWRDLLPYFGLEEYEKEEIEEAGDLGEQKRKLLVMWTQKYGPRATYRHLCTILWEQQRMDLVEAVCEVIASGEAETSSHAAPQSQSALSRFNRKLSDWYAEYTLPYFFNPRCYKWMPNVSKAYIHPDIASKEEQEEQPDSHKEAALRGQQWRITKKGGNKKIQLEELLRVNSDKKRKVVLVEGGPGMGKSTLAWQICHRWGRRELFDQYSTVLLLPLRDERVQQAKQVEDLFFSLRDKKAREEVKQEIDSGRDTLVILDGLDELPGHLISEQSIFTDLISGNVLGDATILVTSRPSATQQLLTCWKQRISNHFVICGFNTVDIEEYAETILSGKKLTEFILYLSIHPHIQSIMYVPLHSAIVMAVYLQRKQLPNTLTQLYVALVETILSQYLDDHPEYCGKEAEDVSRTIGLELPKVVNTHFLELCKIAFDTICTQELIFSDKTLPNVLHDLGFTDSAPGLFMHRTCSYNFLHLSIQEFLAACHVSLLSPQDQEQLLLRSREEHHLRNMMTFVGGLTKFEGIRKQAVKQVLVVKGKRISSWFLPDNTVCCLDDYSLELLYECQNMSVLDKEDTFAADMMWSSQTYHWLALGYCIANSNCTWDIQLDSSSVSIGPLPISSKLVGMFVQGLHDCQTQPAYTIKHIECKGYCDEVDGKLFSQTPAYFTTHIQKIYLTHLLIFVSESSLTNLCQWLPFSSTVQILGFFMINFNLQIVQALASMFQQNQSPTEVVIYGSNIDNDSVCCLARALHSNTTLTVLRMHENTLNSIDERGVLEMAEMLKHNTTLMVLNIYGNSVGEKGVLAMAKMLEHNTTLKELHVENRLNVKGRNALVGSLAVNHHLKKLYISREHKREVVAIPAYPANKERVIWC